jgi:AraC-like DNA-binding protein
MQARKEHVTHPESSLRFLRFELDAFRAPLHTHEHAELTWIERGEGLRLVGDDASPFAPGDLVFLGPGVPHTWITSSQRRHPRPAATVVQFAPRWLAESPWPEVARAAPVLVAARRGLEVRGRCAREVKDHLVAMRDGDPYARLAGLIRICGALVRHPRNLRAIAASRAEAPGSGAAPRRIDRVIDWVQRHHSQALWVDEAARLAHVSPAAFSRWFKREVGKSFTQYVNDLRFSVACVRLRQSDLPIAAIAADCGFATMSHFNRQFLLRAGMTPRDYRRGT